MRSGADAAQRLRGLVSSLVLALAAAGLAACTTPPPPRPAFVPLAGTNDFGYSERDLGPDKIEVIYRGAPVEVSPTNPREDPRSKAQLDLAHDLALWRAAEIAQQRGRAGLQVNSENRNTDVVVQQRNYYRPSPFYDPFYDPYDDPFWPGYRHPWGPGYGPQYTFQQVRTASARAEVRLMVTLFAAYDAKVTDMQSTADTLARLKAARSGAVY